MTEDRRKYNRVTAHLPATWEGMSGIQEARLEDISLSGCFVNSNGRVEIGQKISLRVELRPGEWMPLKGDVISHQPGIGFGLVFKELSAEVTGALKELL
jgi:PilZ domain-containing protein